MRLDVSSYPCDLVADDLILDQWLTESVPLECVSKSITHAVSRPPVAAHSHHESFAVEVLHDDLEPLSFLAYQIKYWHFNVVELNETCAAVVETLVKFMRRGDRCALRTLLFDPNLVCVAARIQTHWSV